MNALINDSTSLFLNKTNPLICELNSEPLEADASNAKIVGLVLPFIGYLVIYFGKRYLSKQENFFHAIESGSLRKVRLFLAFNAINVNHQYRYGYTPLIYASRYGHTKIVQILLSVNGININHQNSQGRTALIFAAGSGYLQIVQALLAVDGIDVNQTAIKYFPTGRPAGVFEILAGSYLGGGQFTETALMTAARLGHLQIVQALLAVDGINMELRNCEGQTAIMIAKQGGHTEVVQAIFKKLKEKLAGEILPVYPKDLSNLSSGF